MRGCVLLLFVAACNPWYVVSRQSLEELGRYRLHEREHVGLRAERVIDEDRVVLRAADLDERRDTDAPTHVFLRVRRPLIVPGVVTLASGVTALLVGGYLAGLNAQLPGENPGLLAGASLASIGGGLFITGIILIGVGANGHGQTIKAGKLPIELGAWPVPQERPRVDPD